MKVNKSGFTLVEMIMVVAVLAILVTISVVAYNGSQARSRDAKRKTDIGSIVKALELYYADNGAYPIASGTVSVIGTTWYTSGDASWSTLSSTLTTAKAIDALPVDPKNNGLDPRTSPGLGYAYFTGNYCGHTSGQWYLLVYRYEVMQKEMFTDGECPSNDLGTTYYSSGNASVYRSLH